MAHVSRVGGRLSFHRRAKDAQVLATSQKQVRHIECIVARRLTLGGKPGQLLDTYFTLHSSPNSKAFYTSEVVHHSVNPTWRHLDLHRIQPWELASANITVRVWGRPWTSEQHHEADEFQVLVQYDVDMHGLSFLRKKLVTGPPIAFKPDTLLFELREGFYCTESPSEVPSDLPPTEDAAAVMPILRVNSSRVKRGYTKAALLRAHDLQKAIALARASAEISRQKTTEVLQHRQTTEEKRRPLAQARLKRAALHDELLVQRELVQNQQEGLHNLRQQIASRDEKLQTALQRLAEHLEALKRRKKKLRQLRDHVADMAYSVLVGQATKILQLHSIYPIKQLSPSVCSVCDIKLPNSDYSGCDEAEVAAALGHVSHLVFMIAKYLDVPLRYALNCKCSRSTIRDDVSTHVGEKSREFPLYVTKVKERKDFELGVFLLNKNVQQLLEHCGVKVGDLRNTLPNLRMLILHFSQVLTKGPGKRSQPIVAGGKATGGASQSGSASASPAGSTPPSYSSGGGSLPKYAV
eukprot:m.125748 g.125748  ORF g.125748 m.125748 type:complete len:522 (+) comp16660_c1_seq1:526-2091(+)